MVFLPKDFKFYVCKFSDDFTLHLYTKNTFYRPENVITVLSMAIDPVCDMEVDEEEAEFKTEYKGKTYYFCAPGCKTLFEENPEEYLD